MSNNAEQSQCGARQPDLSRRNALREYQQFSHLAGQAINVTTAEAVYLIPGKTIWRWAQRGFIRIIGHNPDDRRELLLDHQDIAYCALIYQRRKADRQGKRVFKTDGTPWEPRPERPKDAAARREMRQTALEMAMRGKLPSIRAIHGAARINT